MERETQREIKDFDSFVKTTDEEILINKKRKFEKTDVILNRVKNNYSFE